MFNVRAWAKAGLVAAFLVPSAVYASPVTFTLDQDGCTGGCGPGPFGTVTLDDPIGDVVHVNVTLNPGFKFLRTGGHDGFTFNTDIPVTLSSISAGFFAGPAPAVDPPFSSGPGNEFDYSVKCCTGNGASHSIAGPLDFDVTGTGLTQADFTTNGLGYYFALDVYALGTTGKTGSVAAIDSGFTPCPDCTTQGAVPEPATLALFGAGLAGLGAFRRRRKRLNQQERV